MSPLFIVLIVILLLVLFGGIGGPYVGAPWRYGYGYGHSANGILGVLLIILVVWFLMGRL